jgi:hypothetical protein
MMLVYLDRRLAGNLLENEALKEIFLYFLK